MFVFVVLAVILVATRATEWVIDPSTQAGCIVGVGAGDSKSAVAASDSDSEGARPQYWNGDKWETDRNLVAGIVMDGDIQGSLSAFTSFFSIYVSNDGGNTFASAGKFGGPSQSMTIFGNGKIAAVGSLTSAATGSVQGLALSTDGKGKDWELINIDGAADVRYGAFPNDDTWFMTSGMWNSTDSAQVKKVEIPAIEHFDLSARVQIGKGGNPVRTNVKEGDNGWWGKIYKTTDAGKSFTEVYATGDDDEYYFNQVSCSSDAQSCVAVGEGKAPSGEPYAVALATNDGGKSWTKTWESTEAISMMSVRFNGDSEVWIAPAVSAGRGQLGTQFMVSSDGGQTWTAKQTLDNCFAISMDFADGVGVCACLNSSGTAGALAMYKP
jgi:hypothetical protein